MVGEPAESDESRKGSRQDEKGGKKGGGKGDGKVQGGKGSRQDEKGGKKGKGKGKGKASEHESEPESELTKGLEEVLMEMERYSKSVADILREAEIDLGASKAHSANFAAVVVVCVEHASSGITPVIGISATLCV